jgi:hypothetical protein
MQQRLEKFLSGAAMTLGEIRELDAWLALKIAHMQCTLDPDHETYHKLYCAWMDVLDWYDQHPEEMDS